MKCKLYTPNITFLFEMRSISYSKNDEKLFFMIHGYVDPLVAVEKPFMKDCYIKIAIRCRPQEYILLLSKLVRSFSLYNVSYK